MNFGGEDDPGEEEEGVTATDRPSVAEEAVSASESHPATFGTKVDNMGELNGSQTASVSGAQLTFDG